MPKRKTHEEFIKEINNQLGNEYIILGRYINNCTKIAVQHNKCNHVYMTTPQVILAGGRCPNCQSKIVAEKLRKTHEEFLEEVFKLSGNEYTIIGRYKNSKIKITVKHNLCGFIYDVYPTEFLKGLRLRGKYCPRCSKIKKKTHDEFVKEVFIVVKDEYSVLGKYVNDRTKILMQHNKCGYIYNVRPNSFLRGRRCPQCFGTFNKTHKKFIEEVFTLVGDEYSVLGKYINDRTKILMQHNKCGYIYKVKPNHFLQGIRCPQCSRSQRKGEERIADYLQKHNISFIREYKIKECKYKRPLPFDFAIFNGNKLKCLIEYDGIQHFVPVSHFGGEMRFKDRIYKDNIRNNYCKNNNIPLIRIPYTETDIEEYLNKELLKLNIIQTLPLKRAS